jgi:hypothetical protein
MNATNTYKRPIEADEIKIIMDADGNFQFPNYSAWHDFFTGELENFRVEYTADGVPFVKPYKGARWCG